MIAPMLPLFFPSGLIQPVLMSAACVIFRVVFQTEHAAPAMINLKICQFIRFHAAVRKNICDIIPIHLTCGTRSRIKNLEGVIRFHIEPKILQQAFYHCLFWKPAGPHTLVDAHNLLLTPEVHEHILNQGP